MTTVIVLKGKDSILMAADGLSVSHDEIVKDNYKKVTNFNGKLLIGFSGSAKIWEYLLECLKRDCLLMYSSKSENYISLVRDEIFEFFLNDNRMKRMLEEKDCDISLLLADKHNVYHITSEFECVSLEYPFAAIGSGRAWALGVLEGAMCGVEDLHSLELLTKDVFDIVSKYHLYTNNKINTEYIDLIGNKEIVSINT